MGRAESKNNIGCLIIYLISLSLTGCAYFLGVYRITDSVYFWDVGDQNERIIIYNSVDKPWKIISGIPIVPNDSQYQENAKNGIIEYVDDFLYEQDWLFVRTIVQTNSNELERYWMVYLPSHIEKSVEEIKDKTYGPFMSSECDSVFSLLSVPNSFRAFL